jgi:hypothetical protein
VASAGTHRFRRRSLSSPFPLRPWLSRRLPRLRSSKFALVLNLETFFPTATRDAFGTYKPTKTSDHRRSAFVRDYEHDTFFNQTEVEYGRLMFAGVSTYVRPGIGLGDDKPLDWNLEFGVKIIH